MSYNDSNNKDDCLQKCNDLKLNDLIEKIPSEDRLENMSEILKALSDPLRLKIIYLLKNGELCVCHINSTLNKPQSTISHHLTLLKKAKILKSRKNGKWNYYTLYNDKIIDLIEEIMK
ncbi:MAG: metalloregulator ArsR/SmtB family transcription factor [Methanobrevibacter sp.]|jgi:ArsR family transcriptional regulator|nr:metalloregulator ArsR/SmtB family transcription factor [Candidatus Methanoflexus mossambicus]